MNKILLLTALIAFGTSANAQKKGTTDPEKKPASLSGMNFRSIGPALVSGRVIDLAVVADNPDVFYVAAASGGVWKTVNHGTTFQPIFDAQGSYSIGCVTLDPQNPHTVWVGTGENNNQRSVAYGDGVYKSLDDGQTWKNMGLTNSEHIGRIVVHPKNGDVVFVAAYGPLWSDGGDRGIYRTQDGGVTWERILHVSEQTGFSDLWMDPRDPNTLYAAAHQRRRHVWTYLSGGPESAIYKTTDGGTTWRKIMTGLPADCDLGRIALAVSPANPDIVYAMVEGYDKEHGGFYRSDNRGENWKRQSDYFTSGNYYVELIPDPLNPDKVFSMDTWLQHTVDGGKTFQKSGEESKHVDNHAMWVDPKNTNHWLTGCDGGLYETWDAAKTWKFYTNLNITQFYRVAVDYDLPFYNVYGGTQDNNTLGGPSRTTNTHGISNYDWQVTRGGDGFQPQVDPTNPDIVYSEAQYGWLVRFNRKTGERVNIKPIERPGDEAYRWNWDAPFIISAHDPSTLYFAANRIFKSRDRGDSWDVISEDLSQQIDRNTLKVMGTTWGPDAVALHQSTSVYGNVVSLTESPIKAGLLYVGTDDGLVYRTTDDGANWTKISSFAGIPARTYVMDLVADRFDEQIVYAVFNNHKNGDFKPYILKSSDQGKTWTSMASNLPQRGAVYSLVQDHQNAQLLFAGTEYGVYFTSDGGKTWVQLSGGLPTIAVRDMVIQERENDLVLATFGRGFYILDDYTPLRTISDTTGKTAHLFPVKTALSYIESNPLGTKGKASQGESFFTTPNPPAGVVFRYYLRQKPATIAEKRRALEKKSKKEGKDVAWPSWEELAAEDAEAKPFLVFEISNSDGQVVARYTEQNMSKGINQSTWDYRLEVSSPVELKESDGGRYGLPDYGPLALPGTYYVRILAFHQGTLEEWVSKTPFEVKLLYHDQIAQRDLDQLKRFIEMTNGTRKEITAAALRVQKMDEQLNYMHAAVMKTPGANADWLVQMDALRREVNDMKKALHGDFSRARREYESYPGMLMRVELVADNIKSHTESPTQSEWRSLEAAQAEYAALAIRLEQTETQLEQLAGKLRNAGAPFFER